MKIYPVSIYQGCIGLSTAVVVTALLWSLAWGQTTTTGVVNRKANLRDGPGTTYAIVGSVTPGQTVTIVDTSEAGDWYQLANNQWIAAFLVDWASTTLIPTATGVATAGQPTATAIPRAATTGPTATNNANLRAGPGTTYAIVGSVQRGQALTLLGRNADGAWLQLTGGTWIAAFLVNGVPTGLAVATPSSAAAPAAVSAPSAITSAVPANISGITPGQVKVRLVPIFSGLEQPTFVTHAGDGSGRFFVLERPGRIRIYAGPNTEQQMFLDITDRVGHSGYEQGLLGLAFPPNFRDSGYFFINYTNNDGDTIIAR